MTAKNAILAENKAQDIQKTEPVAEETPTLRLGI
jgi:hypothetical protein